MWDVAAQSRPSSSHCLCGSIAIISLVKMIFHKHLKVKKKQNRAVLKSKIIRTNPKIVLQHPAVNEEASCLECVS